MLLDDLNVEIQGGLDMRLLRLGDLLMFVLPKDADQREQLHHLLLRVDIILHVERVEGDWFLLLEGEVDTVLSMRTLLDQLAKTEVGITHVDDHQMLPLLIFLRHHHIGEEGFTRSGRTQNEFILRAGPAPSHRLVTDIDSNRRTADTVGQFQAMAILPRDIPVVAFHIEKADAGSDKG